MLDRIGLTEEDLAKSYHKYYRNLRNYSPARRFVVRTARMLKMRTRLLFGR